MATTFTTALMLEWARLVLVEIVMFVLSDCERQSRCHSPAAARRFGPERSWESLFLYSAGAVRFPFHMCNEASSIEFSSFSLDIA